MAEVYKNIKNKVCVTGASGFIGKKLCRHLQEKNAIVKSLVRQSQPGPWDEQFVCDVKELNLNATHLKQFLKGTDTLFHLAGIAHTQSVSKEHYWETNVLATQNLLSLAISEGVQRFIYFSSVKAEESNDEYGRSKKAAEEIVLKLGKEHGIHVCILRPALVYGPGVKGNLLNMMRGIDKGWFPPPPEIHNRRSMVSIDDVILAAILVSEHPNANGKIYTITDRKIYSTHSIYNAMRKALGLPKISWSIPYSAFRILAKLGDCVERILKYHSPINSAILNKFFGSAEYNSELIGKELDWNPTTDFFTVLPEIVDAYKKIK